MDVTIDGLDVDAAFGDAINVTGAYQSFNLPHHQSGTWKAKWR